jgi:hypothetical protein
MRSKGKADTIVIGGTSCKLPIHCWLGRRLFREFFGIVDTMESLATLKTMVSGGTKLTTKFYRAYLMARSLPI